MNITLRPETEKRISEKIRRGDFDSADAMIEQAVTFFLNYEEEEMDEADFRKVQSAVEEGLLQAARGEGISLEEFDQKMRAKYGIQRQADASRRGRCGGNLSANSPGSTPFGPGVV